MGLGWRSGGLEGRGGAGEMMGGGVGWWRWRRWKGEEEEWYWLAVVQLLFSRGRMGEVDGRGLSVVDSQSGHLSLCQSRMVPGRK